MRIYIVFLFVAFIQCGTNKSEKDLSSSIDNEQNNKKEGLRAELEKYKGFYSAVESTDGIISANNLPSNITSFKKEKINSIKIDYLRRIENGYILTFGIDFSGYNVLVVSCLNNEYCLVDYRIFTNGLGSKEVENDTIAWPRYFKDSIIVEIMHPNKENEPEFRIDGIRKEKLKISKDLKLITTR